MPSREQLESALRGAHAAGDTAAATQLATALKNLREVSVPEGPMQTGQIIPRQELQQPPVAPVGVTPSQVIEPALAMGSGIMAEPIAGLAGLAQTVNPYARPGAGAEAVESTRQALTYAPRTMAGREGMRATGEALAPVGEALQSVQKGFGEAGYRVAGPIGGAIGETIPTAAMMALGAKPVQSAIKTGAKAVTGTAKDVAKGVFSYQTPAKQKIAEMLTKGATDIETARFKLAKPPIPGQARIGGTVTEPTKLQKALNIGGPKVVKDKVATEAIKQGFDEGVIAAIKGASPADKKIMQEMTNIMEQGKKNSRFAMTNRPGDVVGNSLMNRFKVVHTTNRTAGRELDSVAKSLKGKRVEFTPDNFVDDLTDMGVQVGDDLKLNFVGSDIEGLAGPMRTISQVFNRMKTGGKPDAYDLHRMKRFIDEQVTYGKNAEGLGGKTEQVLKKLRRNIDDTLDNKFPEYNDVNSTYSETIGALDAFQDAAGRKMDLLGPNSDKAVGTLVRRLMSNTQSRVNLLDSINDIESVAAKYGGKFSDDLLTQVLYADELDNVFGPVARTSFQGQIGQAVERGARATISPREEAIGALAKGAEKLRGINQEGAFKSIKELLKE